MNRNLVCTTGLAIALLVAGPTFLKAQDGPTPPAPPDPLESSQVFVLNDGTAHLGVTLSDVTPQQAKELKLPAVAGAMVDTVQKDSAAAKAGIEAGDVILEFDGVNVRSSTELRRLIRETPPGRTVALKVVRDGKVQVLSAELKPSSNSFNFKIPEIRVPRMQEIPPSYGPRHVTLGISGDDLTPQLAQFFGVKQGKGVLITEVTRGGAADKAAMKAGDVIVQLNGKPVSGVEELRFVLNHFLDDTRKVTITIVREHREQTVRADLSRFKMWEDQTSSTATSSGSEALADMLARPDRLREQAKQLRVEAERQRALVQAEVSKQQEYLNAEWKRQLREQMQALKDQLREMPTVPIVLHEKDEI